MDALGEGAGRADASAACSAAGSGSAPAAGSGSGNATAALPAPTSGRIENVKERKTGLLRRAASSTAVVVKNVITCFKVEGE